MLTFCITLTGAFSSIGFSIVLGVDLIKRGFSPIGLDALSACFAAEGLTSFSSDGSDEPLDASSFTVACFFRRAVNMRP